MFSLDRDNVLIETIKQAEDGNGIIVRPYETLGTRCTVSLQSDFKIQSCTIVNLLEKQLQPLKPAGSEIRFDIKPFEILSLRLTMAE
ncbi:glycosyl hydrolase-related protein [Pontiella sulfatireligans]|nr:glycosyl hydrolase-related protein [Pontiella sulfatireligans]